MLERSAAALDAQLATSEQSSVLLATAARLPTRDVDEEPLSDALKALQATGLLAAYTLEPTPGGRGRRAQRVTLGGYRPSLSADRCPVLPVVVELLRRTAVAPHITDVTRTASGLALCVTTTGDAPAAGLSVAEVDC